LRQRVALVATLARLYVGVVLIDRERECRGHRRRIVGVVYDHMCQQQCDQRIGYAAGLRPGNMSQIGARMLRNFKRRYRLPGYEATIRDDLVQRLPHDGDRRCIIFLFQISHRRGPIVATS
jgi:hypothetical protein